jgi:phytanoyl-CoA hydroxylase
MRLSPEQRHHFQAKSYVVAGPVVEEPGLQLLRAGYDELMERWAAECEVEREEYERVVSQWTSVWSRHRAFANHVHNTRIAEATRQLLAVESLQLFHDHMISKPPGSSETVPWHQDYPFWPVSHPTALSCWVPLDDITLNSGGLRFMPGAHLEGEERAVDFLRRNKRWGARERDAVAIEVPAGWGVFHSCLSWHTSPPNASETARRAIITILMDASCTYEPEHSGWHPMNDYVTVPPGSRFNPDAFPIIGSTHAA